ncbi:MAG: response regulator, partial [Proteobacteria bacterium]|nr:response regulator [Pseudomonadota bacterium]
KVAADNPEDMEASILHALVTSANFDPADKAYGNQKRAAEILEPLFQTHRDHPGVAHYLIHTYDYPPLAKQAEYLREVVDPAVGALMEEYRRQGALQDTYFVIVSDHGHTPVLDALSLRWLVPWLALAAVIASGLLARLSWAQARARLAAEAAADAQRQSARTLHREREWLTATLGSIGDAVIAVDADQRVTWLNPVAERLTGWPRGEALGLDLDEVVRASPLDGEPMHETLAAGGTGRGEAMLSARDGAERPVDHNSAPIRDPSGAVSGAVIVLRDASERRRVEAELRATDRRKDEFLAMLAHELRNPLAPISTAATLLGMPAIEPGQVREVSAILARQVRHMTELVDDLLEVSRVTRGLVTLDTGVFDVRDSIHDAVEQVRASVDSHRHVLEMRIAQAALWVNGDRTRLTQVVANLLSNAAKYTPAGGRITLVAGLEEGGVRIGVHDTGVGIGPELLPHVFDLFTQGERLLDRSQGGLGIGLALVHTIVDLHGGTVHADSPGPGQGSVFTVELPSVQPMQEPPGLRSAPAGGVSGPLRIVVVDDNADALQTIALLLQLQGHLVRTFDSAESALHSAGEDPADVYILDIGLPGMSGLELARRLRGHPRAAGAMLLALSGYGQTTDVEASRAAGITEHLVKPVDPERLRRALRRVAA